MKLSQLKALVAAIEAAKVTDDPVVEFWLNPVDVARSPETISDFFINTQIDVGSEPLTQHRVPVKVPGVVLDVGDFSIPLKVVPFYN